MLYCDLDVDSQNIFSGVLCLNRVLLNQSEYLAFVGALYFYDTQGSSDPDYAGLAERFQLVYAISNDTNDTQAIPLQATPNQTLSVALGSQNVTIRLYTRTASMDE